VVTLNRRAGFTNPPKGQPLGGLVLAQQLEAGGFSPEQSRNAAAALATKADLHALEQRLIIQIGGMFIVAVGVLLAALRYLPPHP
jgi:hypothetical protein